MDTTHDDDPVRELEEAEPADAPDAADRLAADLATELEPAGEEGEEP